MAIYDRSRSSIFTRKTDRRANPMAHDAISAHARDELGISKTLRASPDSGG